MKCGLTTIFATVIPVAVSAVAPAVRVVVCVTIMTNVFSVGVVAGTASD